MTYARKQSSLHISELLLQMCMTSSTVQMQPKSKTECNIFLAGEHTRSHVTSVGSHKKPFASTSVLSVNSTLINLRRDGVYSWFCNVTLGKSALLSWVSVSLPVKQNNRSYLKYSKTLEGKEVQKVKHCYYLTLSTLYLFLQTAFYSKQKKFIRSSALSLARHVSMVTEPVFFICRN